MRKTPEQVLDWESRWIVPAGIAALSVVAFLIVAQLTDSVSGNGDAELLRSIDEHRSSLVLSRALQALGFALMAVPLFFLFRVVQARSEQVRAQFVGLVLAAPLFLAVSTGLTIGAQGEAADEFVAGDAKSTLSKKEAKEDCVDRRKEDGQESLVDEYEPAAGESALAACERREIEDDEASNAVGEASLTGLVAGLGIAGGLGLLFSFLYVGLWSMRVGVLTRFWGSLGMVSGFAFLLGPLFVVTLIWLLYFGVLLVGLLPGGRPPAWAAGKAMPWPTPGEKAAAELEPQEAPDPPEAPPGDGLGPPSGEKPRKRKRRE